jgi:pimeloyl-ACP methyl ester carboxylesterase
VREVPAFVPWGGEHLAAILAVPEGEARGLVVLSSGPFAPRAHRFQLWAMAAERLAEAGVASIRWDYLGLHDSSGTTTEIGQEIPVEQAVAVAAFARTATGLDRLVAAGNCYGAHVSFALAATDPACAGAAAILPEPAQPGEVGRALRRLGGRRIAAVLRSHPALARLARPARRLDVRGRTSVLGSLTGALARGPVLLLYDEAHLRTGPTDYGKIEARLASLPSEVRARCELRVLAPAGLDKFRSVEVQQVVLDALVGWAVRCFERAAIEPASADEIPAGERRLG